MRYDRPSRSARGARGAGILLVLLLAACGGDADANESAAPGDAASPAGRTRSAARAPGTIAYVAANGRELRLVRPDGTGDRLVWRLPDTLHDVTAPIWSPDGAEIAFASNHEMAMSVYERDLYSVAPDGSGLRRLTNPPAHAEFARLPKGTVTVTIQNLTFDGGPYFVYVMGAPEPKQQIIAPAGATRLTFENVADLGEGVPQPVVVISGILRWTDAAAAADVQPGRTVAAAPLAVTGTPIEHYGADGPFWRADGSRVGYFLGPTCLLKQVPADPPPGPAYDELLPSEVFGPVCAADWGPPPAADQLLVMDARPYTESGETHILRVREGARETGTPVATFGNYVRVIDLRWLPDASGFLVARQDALTDEDVNLYEFTFATRQLRKLTDFNGEMVRHFSVSPDGRSIVFERIGSNTLSEIATLPSDLWIIGRDGSNPRPLVRNATYPAWNPQP
ncbi:MAG TPA: hypothetical protein VHG93_21635 [Longimicrobium sp.]|nr:hypothetical protein [Longimicrobium sp.]